MKNGIEALKEMIEVDKIFKVPDEESDNWDWNYHLTCLFVMIV